MFPEDRVSLQPCTLKSECNVPLYLYVLSYNYVSALCDTFPLVNDCVRKCSTAGSQQVQKSYQKQNFVI